MSSIFYFSYAHKDRDLCERHRDDGGRHNDLDNFYSDICKRVAGLMGLPATGVGFRDREHLSLGDRWSHDIARHLGTAQVLVSLVSPNYLRDPNGSCGREFNVFLNRHGKLQQADAGDRTFRIIPIFWENEDACWRVAGKKSKQILKSMQYKCESLPGSYPQAGLMKLKRTSQIRDYESFVISISERIYELTSLRELPAIDVPEEFGHLESAFDSAPEPTRMQSIVQLKPFHTLEGSTSLPGLMGPT